MHRRSSSGDRLSITPENLSPSPGSSPGLQVIQKGSPYSGSSLEVATTSSDNSNGHRTSSGPTSYNSSTLPLRRPRSKISAEEKSRKVRSTLLICYHLIDRLHPHVNLNAMLNPNSKCNPNSGPDHDPNPEYCNTIIMVVLCRE